MAQAQKSRAPRGSVQEALYGKIVRRMPRLRGLPTSIRQQPDGSLIYLDEQGRPHDYNLAELEVGKYLCEAIPAPEVWRILYKKFTSGNLGATMLKRDVEDGYYVYEGIPLSKSTNSQSAAPAKAESLCVTCANGDCSGECFLGHDWGVGCDDYEEIQ